jgi:hypothetical protein
MTTLPGPAAGPDTATSAEPATGTGASVLPQALASSPTTPRSAVAVRAEP